MHSPADAPLSGAGEPTPIPLSARLWVRILLIAAITALSVITTLVVAFQLRSDDAGPELPSADPNTGIALTTTMAHTHGIDIQFPEGFDFLVEHWEPDVAAFGLYHPGLDQRQQLFIYEDTADFVGAIDECHREMASLGTIVDEVTQQVDPTPLEPGTDEVAAYCLLSGILDDDSRYAYAYRIFTPPTGPVIALQTRTGLDQSSELHTSLETYFTCIAAAATNTELATC